MPFRGHIEGSIETMKTCEEMLLVLSNVTSWNRSDLAVELDKGVIAAISLPKKVHELQAQKIGTSQRFESTKQTRKVCWKRSGTPKHQALRLFELLRI